MSKMTFIYYDENITIDLLLYWIENDDLQNIRKMEYICA